MGEWDEGSGSGTRAAEGRQEDDVPEATARDGGGQARARARRRQKTDSI